MDFMGFTGLTWFTELTGVYVVLRGRDHVYPRVLRGFGEAGRGKARVLRYLESP